MCSSVMKTLPKQLFNLTRVSTLGRCGVNNRVASTNSGVADNTAATKNNKQPELYVNLKRNRYLLNSRRSFSLLPKLEGSAGRAETTSTIQGLNKLQAQELILRLTTEERTFLVSALNEYQSKCVKDEFEGQLALSRWRSKYGRPSKLPSLGDVDPTGTYCAVPEDWLLKKCAESEPTPTTRNLIDIAIANSIPFVGFGFLDNFFMILFGDYIDLYICSYFCLSTMAAAALGNTFSDVLGIGTAFHVERMANKIGFNPPKLSPIQMDMPKSRNFANLGRVLGVTIGCLLGMLPLMFINKKPKKGSKDPPEIDEKLDKLPTDK